MMTLAQAARAMGGELHGTDGAFSGVSTDSRALARGELFVALRGERFDGHAFVPQAARAGAAGVVIARDSAPPADCPCIVVADPLIALGRLAQHWRRQFAIPVVALTGSNGKTTVKEMLAAMLRAASAEAAVLATEGNLNNHIGLPLMLLRLRAGHRYGVFEMGMNHAGEIRYLSGLAEPDVALVNNIGRAHIEFLGSEEAIARAKGEIFEGLKPDGTAVINADDRFAPLLRELAGARPRVEFGLEQPAPVTGRCTLRLLDSEIRLTTPLGEAAATVPAPGLHNVRNALAAAAAATALGITPATIAAGLAGFRGAKGRLQKREGLAGAAILDDTYNANPDSVRAAIAVLAALPGRRVLVLGDMGELGPGGEGLHAQAGEYARSAGIDVLYTLGELAAHAARAFGRGARHFQRIEDLLAAVESALAPDVTVLVKGSRFMQMERVVKGIERGAAATAGGG